MYDGIQNLTQPILASPKDTAMKAKSLQDLSAIRKQVTAAALAAAAAEEARRHAAGQPQRVVHQPGHQAQRLEMGGEGVDWVSHSMFTKVPHVFQNLGDGTYFHSGLLAIRQSIAAGVNITYKILYNDAVAMTGGQRVGERPEGHSVLQIMQSLLAEGVAKLVIVTDEPQKYDGVALASTLVYGWRMLPGVALGAFVVNLTLSYRVVQGPTTADFYVKGMNLTNEDAREHTSVLKDRVPLPGRGIVAGLKLTF